MNISLIGLQNSGKTTVGQALAQHLQCHFIDTDRLIEQTYLQKTNLSKTVRNIFRTEGEAFFRTLESEVVQKIRPATTTVIATGGGCVLDGHNMKHLKNISCVVYLFLPLELFKKRTAENQSDNMPAYVKNHDSLENVYEYREKLYQENCHHKVYVQHKEMKVLVNEIIDMVKLKIFIR